MIQFSQNGTKLTLEFQFTELNIAIGFPCSLFIVTSTNCEEAKTATIPYQNENFSTFKMDLKLTANVNLFPQKNNPISIEVIFVTDKGEKCAGKIKFDIFTAITTRSLNWLRFVRCLNVLNVFIHLTLFIY